ncbi:unnamed protein product [Rotaria socialis]|uniref:Uncharacterized protein n=2 Tax=Rotaria socialis TaxID=392032 RepID=A0A820C4U7_9BILA|nr:unnamed protein product [Rotaria socialis]CAF4218015.1 unnamed protein product [Rotaria socialis]
MNIDVVSDKNPAEPDKFFQKLFDTHICTCRQYNRNTNAYPNDSEEQQQQLYPQMRKLYNDDTDLLEYVYIIMSTVKPSDSLTKQQDETCEQPPHRQQTRVSKQRAKVRITEYCREK